MALMIVEYRINMDGLGTRKKLLKLSEKTITVAARKKIRYIYEHNNVKVSCSAEKNGHRWKGSYSINQVIGDMKYQVSEE